MTKVMFICTGNICRSAMAHAMLEKIAKEKNMNIKAYSCGVFAEPGDYPTREAVAAMEEYDVNLKNHRATNIRNSEIEDMDIILCATIAHKNNVINMYPELKEKIYTMKEYSDFPSNDLDIKDPWGYDLAVYRNCVSQIEKCIEKIIEKN